MRYKIQTILTLLVLAAVGAGCAREKPAESSSAPLSPDHPRKISFQTDWFPQAEHGGFYQALAKGYYADAGLDVTLLPGGPAANVKLKVARGDADLGMNRSDNLILAVGKENLPLVMIAAVYQHDYEALLVHAESPVKSFADLNGRTLVASPGQAWIYFLQRKYGITFNQIPNKGGVGAFLADREVIQQGIFTNEPYLARQQGVAIRVLGLADAGYDVYTAIFCRRDFAKNDPEATRAFVTASLRGWKDYLEGDPAPAHAEIMRRNSEMTAEFLAFSRGELIRHKLVTGDSVKGESIGQLSPSRLREEIKTLVDLGMLDVPISAAEVSTAAFQPSPKDVH